MTEKCAYSSSGCPWHISLCLDDYNVDDYNVWYLGVDDYRVELALLCFLGLDVCPVTFLRGCGHFLYTIANTESFYYEEIKRDLNRILIYECRCDDRLRAKDEGSTRLAYTRLRGGLEHLKIETRLIDERFEIPKKIESPTGRRGKSVNFYFSPFIELSLSTTNRCTLTQLIIKILVLNSST
jgi:hypothetical protein